MKNIQLSPLSLFAGSAVTAGLFLLTGMQGTLTTERMQHAFVVFDRTGGFRVSSNAASFRTD